MKQAEDEEAGKRRKGTERQGMKQEVNEEEEDEADKERSKQRIKQTENEECRG